MLIIWGYHSSNDLNYSKYKEVYSNLLVTKVGMVGHACNLSIQEAETGESSHNLL